MLTFLIMSKRQFKFISSLEWQLTSRAFWAGAGDLRVEWGGGRPQLQPCEKAAVRRGKQSFSGKKIKVKTTASFDLSICFILA